MRLIDADAIPYTMLYKENWMRGTGCEKQGAWKSSIDAMPTIEAERREGLWIPAFNGQFKGGAYWFYCSECKRIVPEVRNGGWNFCPECGAEMK